MFSKYFLNYSVAPIDLHGPMRRRISGPGVLLYILIILNHFCIAKCHITFKLKKASK